MANYTRATGDATLSEHAGVSCGGKQKDATEHKTHENRGTVIRAGSAVQSSDAKRKHACRRSQAEKEAGPVEWAGAGSAASGEPGAANEIEGEDSGDDIADLRLEDGEPKTARGQGQHSQREDVARHTMQLTALARDHGDGACNEAERATEDMKDQEREPHAGTTFQTSPMTFLQEDTRDTMGKFRDAPTKQASQF